MVEVDQEVDVARLGVLPASDAPEDVEHFGPAGSPPPR